MLHVLILKLMDRHYNNLCAPLRYTKSLDQTLSHQSNFTLCSLLSGKLHSPATCQAVPTRVKVALIILSILVIILIITLIIVISLLRRQRRQRAVILAKTKDGVTTKAFDNPLYVLKNENANSPCAHCGRPFVVSEESEG